MPTVSIVILVLGIASGIAFLISLWSLYSSLMDMRILEMLGLNGARKALTKMHRRNALSRILQAIGLGLVAYIVSGLPVPPEPIQTYEAIALGILAASAVNIGINYILDERDRKEIVKQDGLHKENHVAVATAEGNNSENTAVATSK